MMEYYEEDWEVEVYEESGDEDVLEIFIGRVEDYVIEKIEKYRRARGFGWVNGMLELAEDEEYVYNVASEIDKQVEERELYGEDCIYTPEELAKEEEYYEREEERHQREVVRRRENSLKMLGLK